MEEKLNNGYQLYVKRDVETKEIAGLYIRNRNGASTRIQTKENELDFIRILPTIEENINEGYMLVLGKVENKFYAYLTEEETAETRKYETYNSYFLNSLVDIEEKARNFILKRIGRCGKMKVRSKRL